MGDGCSQKLASAKYLRLLLLILIPCICALILLLVFLLTFVGILEKTCFYSNGSDLLAAGGNIRTSDIPFPNIVENSSDVVPTVDLKVLPSSWTQSPLSHVDQMHENLSMFRQALQEDSLALITPAPPFNPTTTDVGILTRAPEDHTWSFATTEEKTRWSTDTSIKITDRISSLPTLSSIHPAAVQEMNLKKTARPLRTQSSSTVEWLANLKRKKGRSQDEMFADHIAEARPLPPPIENIRESWRLYLGSQREKDRKLSRESVEVARDSIAMAKDTVEKDRDMQSNPWRQKDAECFAADKVVPSTRALPCSAAPGLYRVLGTAACVSLCPPVAILPDASPLSGPSSGQREQLHLQAQLFQAPTLNTRREKNKKMQRQGIFSPVNWRPPPTQIVLLCPPLQCFIVVLNKGLFVVVIVI
nr:uncharacterized protein LOC101946413 isoform X2 [Chrysemys picta bellii]XP_042697782.1 uncharacterized protein LOC101946413 isoform X2 [Chrysemys picta bellii]XP_042697783.1 uncharacterized protein LOC101946413 isoform X2 [Chrysemys picta bellii]